jgi:hypothetical protein
MVMMDLPDPVGGSELSNPDQPLNRDTGKIVLDLPPAIVPSTMLKNVEVSSTFLSGLNLASCTWNAENPCRVF